MAISTPAPTHAPPPLRRLSNGLLRAVLAGLVLLLIAQLTFFAVHALHMLAYPYPLDYGEGPLLAQIDLLRNGLPLWQLYANPDQPPYAVVNYPPLYHLVAVFFALLTNNALLAGRLVSVLATAATVIALWILTGAAPNYAAPAPTVARQFLIRGVRLALVLALLAIPIVREWAVVVRVDMLGLALGLWALVIVQRTAGRRAVLWAALPLALSLLTKPSLIAAPSAALLWLLFRDWRRAMLLGLLTGAIGAIVVGVLQYASSGWFLVHVVSANANTWDAVLAYGFWHDQLVMLWPLAAAAALGAVFALIRRQPTTAQPEPNADLGAHAFVFLAVYYTLFGAVVAYGVGKVGAYTNYFLEFYAGLIWLAAAAGWRTAAGSRLAGHSLLNAAGAIVIMALVAGAQLRYYPLWSETYLKTAGLIEGRNPPRLTLGSYGVWQDLRRERDLLAAFGNINSALVSEVQAAGVPIFTDIPGVAAQAGQFARIQAFEYRQLLDAGLADQRGLLRELANGNIPLVVLDYLGNWLTPEMITLITHRYAQDGSRGTYDLYRPVEAGPLVPLTLELAPGLRLAGYHVAPAPGGPAYHQGETALLTLEVAADASVTTAPLDVVIQLRTPEGQAITEFSRPLLYGALQPRDWAGTTLQHMQPLALPPELPAGTYQLALALRPRDGAATFQPITTITIAEADGRLLGERGYYVPAPLLAAWRTAGGDDPIGPGDPLMPAVPFATGTTQCFVRGCFQLANTQVTRLPLGTLIHLADAGLRSTGIGGSGSISPAFQQFWGANGGEQQFGLAISSELIRGDQIVQYTQYARLERPLAGGAVHLGALGDEYLRLPGGGPYRWPEYPPP